MGARATQTPSLNTGSRMSNNRLRPPWLKTPASRNIAKRARLAAMLKRKAAEKRQAELAAAKLDTAR